LRLKVPDLSKRLMVQVNPIGFGTSSSPVSLEANMVEVPNSLFTSTIICAQNGKILWEDRLKSHATFLVCHSKFFAVGCSDGLLFLYSFAGRYILPALVLGDPLCALEVSANGHLMAITSSASVHIWDILNQRVVLQTSLLPILSSDIQLKRAKLSEDGKPLITLSTFQSFLYHTGMQVWLRVADDRFTHSEFYSILQPIETIGLLSELQTQAVPSFPSLHGIAADQRAVETISHLEHQLASAQALNSPKEYKFWLVNYVRKLTTDANESKLRELCSFLLGPPDKISDMKKSSWKSTILALPKRELLKDLMPIISENRGLQRFVNEFREALQQLE